MRLKYNAPVILTFTLLSTLIYIIHAYAWEGINSFFMVLPDLENTGFRGYFGVVSHVLGHSSWEHILGNFSLILLLGPILEEKYGSKKLLLMMFFTALITGLLNVMFLDTALLGASGIVFMLILLSSITNYKNGDIPITFLLVIALYLGKEVLDAFKNDSVSQFGHIIGGICGAFFGFMLNENTKPKEVIPKSKTPLSTSADTMLKRAEEDYKSKDTFDL